jgi:hypothetical protein
MARGLVWMRYLKDDGATVYAKLADRDEAADPNRGWVAGVAPTDALFPRGAKPRMVYGVSPTTGRRNHTIIGSAAAPLWTGVATEFVCRTTDAQFGQESDTYTVTRRRGESFPVPH